MEYQRLLKRGMTGSDVRYIKDALVSLGFLEKSTHDTFGSQTAEAVRAYQRTRSDLSGTPLLADGVVGQKTWAAIARDLAELSDAPDVIPANIGPTAARAIHAALSDMSGARRDIVLAALPFAFDPATRRDYPFSLYIRGGNLYNTDLRVNIIDKARIESGAKRQPAYYNAGSKEMMLKAVRAHPETTGADCSGGIVGLLRKLKLVSSGFDRTANQLCSERYAKATAKSGLRPGDFVGRPAHIGLYVGGGYVVEWAGKRYGCQLTGLDRRMVHDFVEQRERRLSAWTKFCDPSFY